MDRACTSKMIRLVEKLLLLHHEDPAFQRFFMGGSKWSGDDTIGYEPQRDRFICYGPSTTDRSRTALSYTWDTAQAQLHLHALAFK